MSQAAGRPDLFGHSKDDAKPSLRKKASVGLFSLVAALVVWSFVLGTAARCFQFAPEVWNGGTREFMLASIGSLSFSAAGLHYDGQWGAILAGGQGVLVLLGLGMTLSPAKMMRRLGSLILMAWAGLWVAGGVSLAMEVASLSVEDMARIGATGVIFFCTAYRTARIWANRKKGDDKKKGKK
ncbi:MAG: hypothetical protein AAFN41_07850 [Planctomycetota bacterium]